MYKTIIINFIILFYLGIINVPVVNTFVVAVPWMIYAKHKNNYLDNQKFYDVRKDSYALFAVIIKIKNNFFLY